LITICSNARKTCCAQQHRAVEVSPGGCKTCRLSLRGNRRVIHMAATAQIRYPHS
jgi:hypothetical protein